MVAWNVISTELERENSQRRQSYQEKTKRLTEFDERLSRIPGFSHRPFPKSKSNYLRTFAKGIPKLSFLTAIDYQCLMHQIPFVIANSGELFMSSCCLSKILKTIWKESLNLSLYIATFPWKPKKRNFVRNFRRQK